MIKQLEINGLKSYDDFGVFISTRKISSPKKKSIKETVPFSNVIYDFSKMNGEIYWEERTLEYSFDIAEFTTEEMEVVKSDLLSWLLNVQDADIYDPYIGDYHYHGSFDSDSWEEDFGAGTLSVSFTVYPYKIANYDIKTSSKELGISKDGIIEGNYSIAGLKIDGKSEQNGNPTPDEPIEIISLGDEGNIDIISTGKNMVDINFNSITTGGVTITNNGDGSLTIQGTANHDIGYNLARNKIRLHKDNYYTQSVTILNGNENECYIVPSFKDEDGNTTFNFFSNNQTKLVDKNYVLNEYSVYIGSGATVNATLKVQLEIGKTATAYEPFQENISTIELSQPLRSLPNGVCDTYENGVITRKVGVVTFDGSENWHTWGVDNATSGLTGFYSYDFDEYIYESSLLANYFTRNGSSWGGKEEGFDIAYAGSKYIYFTVKNELMNDVSTYDSSVESFKTWLSNHNIEVHYELATPTIENVDLPSIQVSGSTTVISFDSELDATFEVYYNESQELRIFNNSSHRIAPTITSTGRFTITNDNASYSIGEGTYDDVFYLNEGLNKVTVSGYGTINISFKEERF